MIFDLILKLDFKTSPFATDDLFANLRGGERCTRRALCPGTRLLTMAGETQSARPSSIRRTEIIALLSSLFRLGLMPDNFRQVRNARKVKTVCFCSLSFVALYDYSARSNNANVFHHFVIENGVNVNNAHSWHSPPISKPVSRRNARKTANYVSLIPNYVALISKGTGESLIRLNSAQLFLFRLAVKFEWSMRRRCFILLACEKIFWGRSEDALNFYWCSAPCSFVI